MNKDNLKKVTRYFFSILTLVYSLVLSIFLMVLVVTKMYNNEFLKKVNGFCIAKVEHALDLPALSAMALLGAVK